METKHSPLDRYLGRVRPHLPLTQSRDILLELESTIRDRVDDLAREMGREPDGELFDLVCNEMGEPEHVASGYVTERHLIGPSEYRSFLFYTGLLFALHMVLIGISTALGKPLSLGGFQLAPISGTGFLGMVVAAVSALLFDIGVIVVAVTLLGGTKRFRERKGPDVRVDCSPRIAYGGAVLAILVAVVLNFFRDHVFLVVYAEEGFPLFTTEFTNKLPMITALLGFAAVKGVLYGIFKETRGTLLADAAHGIFGVTVMLFLLRGDPLLALPPLEWFGEIYEPVNMFLAQLTNLVVAVLAIGFGVKTVKRFLRSAQM